MKFTCPKVNVCNKSVILKSIAILAIFAQFSAMLSFLYPSKVLAATLSGGSVALSDSRPSTASTYTITFDGLSAGTIKCIMVQFSTAAESMTGDVGTVVTGATLETSSMVGTEANWTEDNATSNTVKLTYATGESINGDDKTLVLSGITNGGTAENDYFAILTTYTNTDCSTGLTDTGVAAFIYSNGQAVSLTVDPSLTFTVTGVSSGGTVNGATTNITTTATTVPFARVVNSSTNAIGEQVLTVATNASSGYTVYARYTAKPTSGSNDIDDHTGSNATPSTFTAAGTESFGYTTSDSTLAGTADRFTSSGGNKWAAFTTSNAEVMYGAAAAASTTADFGYQVGISGATPAGTYTTTVILTATALY